MQFSVIRHILLKHAKSIGLPLIITQEWQHGVKQSQAESPFPLRSDFGLDSSFTNIPVHSLFNSFFGVRTGNKIMRTMHQNTTFCSKVRKQPSGYTGMMFLECSSQVQDLEELKR